MVRGAVSDSPPDHLSNNPRSPFFKEDVLQRDIGVRFNGAEKTNVEEYCVSEGWIRVQAGKSKDRHGNPMTVRLSGKVEVYFKEATSAPEQAPQKNEEPAKVKAASKAETTERAQKSEKKEKNEKAEKSEEPARAAKLAKAGKADKAEGGQSR